MADAKRVRLNTQELSATQAAVGRFEVLLKSTASS